jgi:hypothetical protein
MGRKAARRRECKTVHSQGYKIVNSRARRETRKGAIRRTAARAIPKARGLRVGAFRLVSIHRAGPRAEVLRAGILRVGALRPGSPVLQGGPNNPTPNNLTLSKPRSGRPK